MSTGFFINVSFRLRACATCVIAMFGCWVAVDGLAEETSLRWQMLQTDGLPTARHEAGFVHCDGKLYLLGGRRIEPVDILEPKTLAWSQGAKPPIELHHFQPVVWENQIYCVGAMTGRYPREQPVDHVMVYDPTSDQWSNEIEIPEDRRRGGAGAVVHGDSVYLIGGIQNGHWDGWVPWLDRFDFKTRQWHSLPDAPRSRDHFQTAILDGRLYAIGGRRSSASTKQTFQLTIPEVDVFDLDTQTWSTLPEESNLPDPRAGCSTFVLGNEIMVAGGEMGALKSAFDRIDALDTTTRTWRTMAIFNRGRHGTGIALCDGAFYTAGGSGNRGGSPELSSTEKLAVKNVSR